MTQPYPQPQYPGFPPAAPQAFDPAQYPQQQPGYPTAPPAPAYPQVPQGYPQPPMGYPQPQPSYPMQGYPQQGQPPAAPLATGTLDGYFSQPSTGGGAALKFEVGHTHVGVVARPISNADIQQQTNPGNGQPAFYKDGRPKFVMKVPLQMQPSAERPDGLGQWYVAGGARDELVRAMSAAGASEGPPEAGAVLQITCTGTRPSGQGMNPAKVYSVLYQRPSGAAPVSNVEQSVAHQQAAPPAQGVDFSQMLNQQQAPPPAPAAYQPPVQQVPVPQAQPPAAPPAPPAPAAAGDLSADQQALLARLTGQTAAV